MTESDIDRQVSRFNGLEPDTEAYWRREIEYWREIRRDAQLNQKPAQLARAAKALTICINHLKGMKHGA